MARFARDLARNLHEDFVHTMKRLKNPDFQDLLLNYPRAKRVFITALEEKDTVTSQKLERYGKFDTAGDYLDAFAQFVKANADKVSALSVLLKRPKDWRPVVFDDLRRAMNQAGFDTAKLQQAHRATGFNALADVISIVKHAAEAQQPILTAEERVARAVHKLVQTHQFTVDQMRWLSLIQEQLVKNLTIDEEDFDLQPLWRTRAGSQRRERCLVTCLLWSPNSMKRWRRDRQAFVEPH